MGSNSNRRKRRYYNRQQAFKEYHKKARAMVEATDKLFTILDAFRLVDISEFRSLGQFVERMTQSERRQIQAKLSALNARLE